MVKPAVHLLLGTESLDDSQTTQRFFYLTHRVAPQGLGLDALGFQLSSDITHKPAHDGYDNQGEERQLPRDEDKGGKVGDDQDGILEQHLQTRHDAVLYLLHITAHTGNDVTLALF